jgi:hypothetical protein
MHLPVPSRRYIACLDLEGLVIDVKNPSPCGDEPDVAGPDVVVRRGGVSRTVRDVVGLEIVKAEQLLGDQVYTMAPVPRRLESREVGPSNQMGHRCNIAHRGLEARADRAASSYRHNGTGWGVAP